MTKQPDPPAEAKRWFKSIYTGQISSAEELEYTTVDTGELIEVTESGEPVQEGTMSDRTVVHAKGGKLTAEQAAELAAMSEASDAVPASGPSEPQKRYVIKDGMMGLVTEERFKELSEQGYVECHADGTPIQAAPDPMAQDSTSVSEKTPRNSDAGAASSAAEPIITETHRRIGREYNIPFRKLAIAFPDQSAALAEARREIERLQELVRNAAGYSAPPPSEPAGVEDVVHWINQAVSPMDTVGRMEAASKAIAAVRQLAEHLRHAHSFAAFVVKERDAAREELAMRTAERDEAIHDAEGMHDVNQKLRGELAALKRPDAELEGLIDAHRCSVHEYWTNPLPENLARIKSKADAIRALFNRQQPNVEAAGDAKAKRTPSVPCSTACG